MRIMEEALQQFVERLAGVENAVMQERTARLRLTSSRYVLR